jgi:hypothetical protein
MVLPRGQGMEQNFPTPAPSGEAVVASLGNLGETAGGQSVNWAQWGQNMLNTGIQDTKGIVGALVGGAGKQSVQQGFDTTFNQQLAQQQQQQQMQIAAQATYPATQGTPVGNEQVYPMTGPYIEPKVEKKFPTWAWVLIGLGGVAAIGGILYFTLGSSKEASSVPAAKSVAGSSWWSSRG